MKRLHAASGRMKAAGRKLGIHRPKIVIPDVLSILNACFGITALILGLSDYLLPAIGFLVVSLALDLLDGYMARKLHLSSLFGKELDSLADAISFVVVPSVLVFFTFFNSFPLITVPIVMCIAGISRLARYNIADSSPSFEGLPTPLFSIVLITLLVARPEISKFWIIGICILLAFLMVSKVRYPALKGDEMRPVKRRLISVLLFIGILFMAKFPLMSIMTTAYVVIGIFILAPFFFDAQFPKRSWLGAYSLGFAGIAAATVSVPQLFMLLPGMFAVLFAPMLECARKKQ